MLDANYTKWLVAIGLTVAATTHARPLSAQTPTLPSGLVPGTRPALGDKSGAKSDIALASNQATSKIAIVAAPDGIREELALGNLGNLNPGADILNTTNSSTSPNLTSYGKVIIHGHGYEDPNQKGRLVLKLGSDYFTPQELAEYLKKHGFKGNAIELVGCNTGSLQTGGKSFAEELSEILQVKVTGYPHQIAVKPGGIIRKVDNSVMTQIAYEFGYAQPAPVTHSGKKFSAPKVKKVAPWFPEGQK